MAQGKGGKTDPVKVSAKKKVSTKRTIFKMSQMREIIKSCTRLRISSQAARAAIHGVDYLLKEMIEGAKTAADSEKRKKILPKHVNACLYIDAELRHLTTAYLIKSGGATGFLKAENHKITPIAANTATSSSKKTKNV